MDETVKNKLISATLAIEGRLVYKKLKDRYRIYCMKCQRYEYVSKKLFKQIQASHICPMCFQEIKPSRMMEHYMWRYIADDNFTGYAVDLRFHFGRKPQVKILEVMHYLGGENIETRYISKCMYSLGFNTDNSVWRVRKNSATSYMWRFCSLEQSDPIPSKKEYIYRAFWDRGNKSELIDRVVKSNQKKIFIDNLLNGKQMEYVVAFDLKSYDDVYRYRTYMKKNTPNIDKVLNIHYLDYLNRNHIKLRDFYDYMDQCRLLGYKLDKPKDFQNRHCHYSAIIEQKKNNIYDEAIKDRYKELIEKAYGSGSVSIAPFGSGSEIRLCAKLLHNCIASVYLPHYAKKETDLYHLDVKGKITIAIEVKDGKLLQARADWNHDCPADLMKHIRKWCRKNEFAIGDKL